MSDLISKRSLLIYLRNWQYEQFAGIGNEKEYNLLEKLIHGIENEPATSEKEIRGKAIEEFAEAINNKISEFVLQHKDNLDFASGIAVSWNIVDEIADQMKEVGE